MVTTDPIGAELLRGSGLACLEKRERHWDRVNERDYRRMEAQYVSIGEIWNATSTTDRRATDRRGLKIDLVVAGNMERAGMFAVAKR